MQIILIDSHTVCTDSLDHFNRYQVVSDVYRLIEGRLCLEHCPFTEDWSVERKRQKAEEMLSGEYISYGAFEDGRIWGAIMLVPEPDHGRMIIDSLHVSTEQRRKGVGRMLIEAAKCEAKKRGANALYVSACSAKETVDFYIAMGFLPTCSPIPSYAEEEPFDIQMECPL